ncbi:hypothetical protein [Schlesneria paludicola]|uniref:hypothetical protein n=1 Tax=Schlesneria paludicola TaxID=360056 RepID=UPI00029B1C87|nr:hypothetical protein [Schlesneria paludicola]
MLLLAQRNPSVSWEPVRLDPSGQFTLWAWFRPVAIPGGLMLVIPAPLFAEPTVAAFLTVRQVVAAAGLDSSQILCWSLGGMNFDSAGGHSPLLDQRLLAPVAGGNLEMTVWMAPLPAAPWPVQAPMMPDYGQAAMSQPAVASQSVSAQDWQMLDAMDSCWNGVVQLEVRVATIRKELGSGISRLNSLNRDLSSDERRTCDSKDLQEWADARRWLRDSISVLSRSVKEIDTGTTSGAGRRHRFEEIHRNHVVPRVPLPGMTQLVNEFETYRKILQNVLAAAQANVARAGRDAENRANGVLSRIGAKMRARRR